MVLASGCMNAVTAGCPAWHPSMLAGGERLTWTVTRDCCSPLKHTGRGRSAWRRALLVMARRLGLTPSSLMLA